MNCFLLILLEKMEARFVVTEYGDVTLGGAVVVEDDVVLNVLVDGVEDWNVVDVVGGL